MAAIYFWIVHLNTMNTQKVDDFNVIPFMNWKAQDGKQPHSQNTISFEITLFEFRRLATSGANMLVSCIRIYSYSLKKRYCMEFGRELPMKMSTCKWYKLQSEAVKGKALVKGHSPELSSVCLKFKKSNN